MEQASIVIWGTGRIGRGFVADLFHAAGYHLVLIDQSAVLIEGLRAAGRYTVVRAESAERQQQVEIDGYTALTTAQADEVAAAVVRADLLALAVFPRAFAEVARQLVPALLARRAQRPDVPLDILLCTNLPHAGPQFWQALQEALPAEARAYAQAEVGVVETLVIRIAPDPPADLHARDPLLVWTNGYPELPVDRRAFKGPIPPVPGLRPVDDMRAEETLKLYTYNTFHAALAYLGALRGHALIADCMADPQVRGDAAGALDEAGRAVQRAYGFPADEMDRWLADVVRHTDNPVLGDTVARYGADPARKLRREDRLVGPALLARQHGLPAAHLARAIAAALHFDGPGAPSVRRRVEAQGLPGAVRELCGLTGQEQDLLQEIVLDYRRLPLEVEWERRAEKACRLGFEYEKVYHGCGQCVLAAIYDALRDARRGTRPLLEEGAFNAVFEAATGLSGGLGLCGDATCSAFTGSVLAFGMLYPRRRDHFGGDRENKYRTFDMVQRLRERYVARYGGLCCHDVHRRELGRAFDLRDPAEREAFEAAGAHEDKCTGVVARAARWAVEIIGQEQVRDALQAVMASQLEG